MTSTGSATTLPVHSTREALGDTPLAVCWVFPDCQRAPTLLQKRALVLGRGDDCDVVLPGSEASRRHAEIRRDGPLWVVRDLQSRNGVHVNGVRTDQAPLESGSVLRIGEWVGVVAPARAEQACAPAFSRIGGRLLGGAALNSALELALRAAKSDLPIIVQGETGTGKELTAKVLHEASGRPGPFIAINCAALPEGLAEAELFGYRKGAFTGADRANLGLFRSAHGGTLFLDELLELPVPLQAKLLRVLQERQVTALGEALPTHVDVRVVAATQESLAEAASAKRFRPDLLARLDGLTVVLPPLRERKEDLGFLVQQLLLEHSGGQRPPAIESRLAESLVLYDWPFNLRELDLVLRRLLVLHGHEPVLKRSHLPPGISKPDSSGAVSGPREGRDESELSQLLAQLRRFRGNVARASAAVGISRQRAYRLMEGLSELDLAALRSQEASS